MSTAEQRRDHILGRRLMSRSLPTTEIKPEDWLFVLRALVEEHFIKHLELLPKDTPRSGATVALHAAQFEEFRGQHPAIVRNDLGDERMWFLSAGESAGAQVTCVLWLDARGQILSWDFEYGLDCEKWHFSYLDEDELLGIFTLLGNELAGMLQGLSLHVTEALEVHSGSEALRRSKDELFAVLTRIVWVDPSQN